jgi:hypothetical protein
MGRDPARGIVLGEQADAAGGGLMGSFLIRHASLRHRRMPSPISALAQAGLQGSRRKLKGVRAGWTR